MSEYQIVKFRAIDRPLTDKQLEFMERQSSRAEFTKWEFKVEYHYSSFRGDVDGMLRNGYDIFLTYFQLRLPRGSNAVAKWVALCKERLVKVHQRRRVHLGGR